jgi:hypothetical protein
LSWLLTAGSQTGFVGCWFWSEFLELFISKTGFTSKVRVINTDIKIRYLFVGDMGTAVERKGAALVCAKLFLFSWHAYTRHTCQNIVFIHLLLAFNVIFLFCKTDYDCL